MTKMLREPCYAKGLAWICKGNGKGISLANSGTTDAVVAGMLPKQPAPLRRPAVKGIVTDKVNNSPPG